LDRFARLCGDNHGFTGRAYVMCSMNRKDEIVKVLLHEFAKIKICYAEVVGERQIDSAKRRGERGSGNPLRVGSRVPELGENQSPPFLAGPRVPASW
jgi:hypothetical protein